MLMLIDTNVFLRLIEEHHPQNATAMDAVAEVRHKGYRIVVVPQVIYEFWSVATRPADVNGLGMSVNQSLAELEELMPSLRLFRDERSIFEIWQRLVIDNDVKGKQVYDARLVAAMLRHGISHLLTFNAADFARYAEVTVVEPHRTHELGPAA